MLKMLSDYRLVYVATVSIFTVIIHQHIETELVWFVAVSK